MKKLETKTKIATITLILVLTISAIVVALPVVNAAEVDTWIYLKAIPDPVGINQQAILQFFMPYPPPRQLPPERPRYGYWVGITIDVTRPDEGTEGGRQGDYSCWDLWRD